MIKKEDLVKDKKYIYYFSNSFYVMKFKTFRGEGYEYPVYEPIIEITISSLKIKKGGHLSPALADVYEIEGDVLKKGIRLAFEK